MFHQVKVCFKDTDIIRFLWRANPQDDIKDYVELAHTFSKVDIPCCTNWELPKTGHKNIPDVKQAIKNKLLNRHFLSIRVFFTDTDDSQDNRGRDGTIFYSTLLLPPAH